MSYEGWPISDLIELSDSYTHTLKALVKQFETTLTKRNEVDDEIRKKLRE